MDPEESETGPGELTTEDRKRLEKQNLKVNLQLAGMGAAVGAAYLAIGGIFNRIQDAKDDKYLDAMTDQYMRGLGQSKGINDFIKEYHPDREGIRTLLADDLRKRRAKAGRQRRMNAQNG